MLALPWLSFTASVLLSATLAQEADQGQSAKLTNRDITEMQAAGLSTEVIIEKIRLSVCGFDTSPGALVQLKKTGISEPVILAMLRFRIAEPPEADRAASLARATELRGFGLVPVSSNESAAFRGFTGQVFPSVPGVSATPYNDILSLIEKKLGDALTARGVGKKMTIPNGTCCRVRIELLQAVHGTTYWGTLSANFVLKVSVDGTDFSRTFQGSASGMAKIVTKARLPGHYEKRRNEAADDLVKSIVLDQQFMKLLTTGLLGNGRTTSENLKH